MKTFYDYNFANKILDVLLYTNNLSAIYSINRKIKEVYWLKISFQIQFT